MKADKLRYRIQVEFGINWVMMPTEKMSLRQWVFDPFAGLTMPGQTLNNPRAQLPKIYQWVDEIGEGRNPETGGKNFHWVSRAFWLRFGVRILGLDVGFAIAWRKKVGA